MANSAVVADGAYKRFRKGELYDSLRDLIPALTGRMFRRNGLSNLDERDFWALQDVSFEVAHGEAFGIIGHNGAGKSTILKLLSGIMKPTRGRLSVQGRLSAIIEVAAGFHGDLTGRENIYLNGTILGMSRSEINKKIDAIIDFSGLEAFIDTPVKRYSSGMYARLGFSVCAHVDPEVMIVDEVLSVGDYVFQQKCLSRMTEIIHSGATVVFVSHNLRAVADLCSRSILLDHGKIVAEGETASIIEKYMGEAQTIAESRTTDEVRIQEVLVNGSRQSARLYEIGETISIDISAEALVPVDDIAIVVWVLDEHQYSVFSTSSERLGYPTFNLAKGEIVDCQFELDLNMAYGAYHLCVAVHRYSEGRTLDSLEPACSLHVGRVQHGYRGIVPAKPRLTRQEVRQPAELLHKTNG
jgi:lipopolysaccharide transport system ATP-binding protein